MSLFHKEEVGIDKNQISNSQDERQKKSYELTSLGHRTKFFLDAIESLDIFTDVVQTIELLESQRLDSQEMRSIMSTWKNQVAAQRTLIEALYAILPSEREGGFTNCQVPLNEERFKKKND